MAQLDETEFRTIIDDVRTRHAAVVALIYMTDRQAMGLLRLYVTLGMATATGAAAGFGTISTGQAFVSRPVAWALAAATIVLLAGSGFCLRTLRGSDINLPGRTADFWNWGARPDIGRSEVLTAYLDNLAVKAKQNNDLNTATAAALSHAKNCGAVAPLAALVIGAAAATWSL